MRQSLEAGKRIKDYIVDNKPQYEDEI